MEIDVYRAPRDWLEAECTRLGLLAPPSATDGQLRQRILNARRYSRRLEATRAFSAHIGLDIPVTANLGQANRLLDEYLLAKLRADGYLRDVGPGNDFDSQYYPGLRFRLMRLHVTYVGGKPRQRVTVQNAQTNRFYASQSLRAAAKNVYPHIFEARTLLDETEDE